MKWKILMALIFICFGCRENQTKEKKIGNEIVKAKFINDSLIDGIAKVYNSNGKLVSETNFIKGIKNGISLSFYENGKIKDSFNYSNNLLNGIAYRYDSNGLLLFKKTYYYGIDIGDNSFYHDGKVEEYYFTNFERKELVNCKYDSAGRCDTLMFNAKPIISNILLDKQIPAMQLFLYFPHPLSFEIIYKLGLIDSQNNKKKESILNTDRLFLDTTLTLPQKDWNYYISLDYRVLSNDSLTSIFFEKLIK